ncbi:MAG: RluA family pseudouridine synthase [Oscillospiraceae bacterium]|nr:RluA family pseudouridine synthase [Oscillospiraceae bacterium]MDD4367976.1 RluA family pseudouridine synthase [Oscillospiraceae bacterium]
MNSDNTADRLPLSSALALLAPLQVIYEDNHLIAVLKPAGILSQADGSQRQDVLSVMKAYIKQRDHKPGAVYLGLLHRLDCPVSGLMLLAKTSKAASRVSAQIREGRFHKYYYAVTEGAVQPSAGIWEDVLEKDRQRNISQVSQSGGKICRLAYTRQAVAETPAGRLRSLVRIELLTGRSHQIRVQFASRGFPLAGDRKYGTAAGRPGRLGSAGKASPADNSPCLFAAELVFEHPVTHLPVHLKAPWPAEGSWSLFSQANPEP